MAVRLRLYLLGQSSIRPALRLRSVGRLKGGIHGRALETRYAWKMWKFKCEPQRTVHGRDCRYQNGVKMVHGTRVNTCTGKILIHGSPGRLSDQDTPIQTRLRT